MRVFRAVGDDLIQPINDLGFAAAKLLAYALSSIGLGQFEAVGNVLHRGHRHVVESAETGEFVA